MPPQSLVSIAIAIACQLSVISEGREQGAGTSWEQRSRGAEEKELGELGRLGKQGEQEPNSQLTTYDLRLTNYQPPITNYHHS